MTLEERFEQLMKVNAANNAQLDYLRKQLEESMRGNRKELQSSGSSSRSQSTEEEGESRATPLVRVKRMKLGSLGGGVEGSKPPWISRWKSQSLRAN